MILSLSGINLRLVVAEWLLHPIGGCYLFNHTVLNVAFMFNIVSQLSGLPTLPEVVDFWDEVHHSHTKIPSAFLTPISTYFHSIRRVHTQVDFQKIV